MATSEHSEQPGESVDARRNRQLMELLNELRLAVPGVQMLFGFLLAVPFSSRFSNVTTGARNLYLVAFLSAATASLCLIAPTSIHRIVWQHGQKQRLLKIANRLAIAGTAFLAVAICAAVGFVSQFLLGWSVAAVTAGVAALLYAGLWFVLPVTELLRSHHD